MRLVLLAAFVHAGCGVRDVPESRPPDDDSSLEETGEIDSGTPQPEPMAALRIVVIVPAPVEPELKGEPLSDWLELRNDDEKTVTLAGWTLSDGSGDVAALQGELAPGERLVLFADGTGADGTHLPFALDKDGDSLVLTDGEGRVVQALELGPLLDGYAFAWSDEGWGIDPSPIAGQPSSSVTRPDASATGPCEPLVDGDGEQLIEGEIVELRVRCAAVSLEGRSAMLFGATLANADPDGQLEWTTGLSDAGTRTFLGATWTSDPEMLPETSVAEVSIADAWDDELNVLVDPLTYVEEWGLPVLHLAPSQALGNDYVPATTTFQGRTYAMEAKYRGAASYSYPQKSFTLEFDDKDKLELSDYGMGNRDHLVLVTTFDDNVYVRQKLVYELWAQLALDTGATRLVPRSFFVVLYLDGVYHGLYMAIDHVDDELARDMGFVGDGNLYKAVDHNANFYRESVYGGDKSTLHDGYEKKEGLPPNDFSDLEALVQFSADSDEATFRAEAPAWMHVDEFVDWFFLVLFTDAGDSAGKNSYLYDDDPTDIDFRYAPWDMNHSLGQDWRTMRTAPVAGTNGWMSANGLFRHFLTHPDSAEEIALRAEHLLLDGPYEIGSVQAHVDELWDGLGRHPERAWDKWGSAYETYSGWSWRDDFTTPDEELDYLHGWLASHDAAVRAIWGL